MTRITKLSAYSTFLFAIVSTLVLLGFIQYAPAPSFFLTLSYCFMLSGIFGVAHAGILFFISGFVREAYIKSYLTDTHLPLWQDMLGYLLTLITVAFLPGNLHLWLMGVVLLGTAGDVSARTAARKRTLNLQPHQ